MKTPDVSSAETREQVIVARKAQAERFGEERSICNANLSSRQIREYRRLDKACAKIIKSSVNELGLSARAHDKILRVARTIADLDASDTIQSLSLIQHVELRMRSHRLSFD